MHSTRAALAEPKPSAGSPSWGPPPRRRAPGRPSTAAPLDAVLSSSSLPPLRPDLEFINSMVDKGAIARLEQVAAAPFRRVSYTEAITILEESIAAGKKKFEFPVSWGIDLQASVLGFAV